jgi:hypothetical protein
MLREVGDVELRKGLTEVRELIDEITPEPASWCVD